MSWDRLADETVIAETIKKLKSNGIDALVVENGEEARKKVIELLPKGAEIMNVTSTTLDQIGVAKDIEEGNYVSLRKIMLSIGDDQERANARRKFGAPEYGIGSVHAVTENGQVVIASGSGSQLPVYAYGASNLIWVVGTQKIVKNLDDAFKRIYEYCLPLESERVKKAYGMPGSSVNKILIFEREVPGRIKLIFVKEKLGF